MVNQPLETCTLSYKRDRRNLFRIRSFCYSDSPG
nr:MAG TPA: hypothetical protein [Caudoviricetes sp.]